MSWGAVGGAAIGAAGSYLASKNQAKAAGRAAEAAAFIPQDVTTPLGQARFSGGEATGELSPELQEMFSGLLGQAGQRFDAAQTPQASIGLLSQILGEPFQQQRLGQESRLLNQGLLGSTAGMNQMRALREAQNRSLLQGALGAQQQFYNQGQGLLSSAINLGNVPSNLISRGGSLGSAEAQAGATAAQFPYAAATSRNEALSGFFGSIGQTVGSYNWGGGNQSNLQSVGGVGGATPRRF